MNPDTKSLSSAGDDAAEREAAVYVRARTADARWASVNALDLDERSFRIFVLQSLVRAEIVASLLGEWPDLQTPLTKAQAEGDA